jgi:hypothetical protein
MDYELFQVSAVKAFGHCRDVKAMVSDMQQVLSAVPGMVRKNERLEKEKADLKQENAALKVELDDWKGNAEGFQPDAYMKLPLDADGEPIHIGDVLYSSGNKFRVVNITVKANEVCVAVYADDGTFFPWANPKYLSRNSTEPLEPEPADSWEKLEEDALKNPCRYFGMFDDQSASCTACPHGPLATDRICGENMRLDLIKRAKRLAGIEEQEGE